MTAIRLYMDEDSMTHALVRALRARGVDVVTALEAGLVDRDDEEHLAHAAGQGRALCSFNVEDFARLHGVWATEGRTHAGIVLARQQRYSVGEHLRRILALTSSMSAEQMQNRLEFLGSLGLRRTEALGLTRGQILIEGGTVTIDVLGKGGRLRRLATGPEGELILAYLERTGLVEAPAEAPIFASPTDPGRPLSGRRLHAIVAGSARRAGVEVQGGENLAPHGLRRSYATRALDQGASLEALRRAMGHASVSTTSRYDRRPEADLVVGY